MSILFNGMDRPTLDAAYDCQAAVANFDALSRERRERTGVLRRNFGAKVDVPYGAAPRQTLDFYPSPRAGAPLFVFIHGGYWQGGAKESYGFVAAGALAHGFSAAVIEYTVAPEGSLATMVDEVRAALAWLREQSPALGADGSRMVLAGHSAGGQLLCMALSQPGIVGAMAISGIFDLEPIRLCYLNDKLGLTPQDVAAFSPIRQLPSSDIPLVVTVGAAELPELVRQSREFAVAASARCPRVAFSALAGHDHFSILDELAEPEGPLCLQLAAFMAAGGQAQSPIR